MRNPSIIKISSSLLKNIYAQDFKGYDPYDLKAYPFFLKLIKWGKKNKLTEIIREVILEFTYHFPEKSRSLFKIETAHNSKALGLIGTSISELTLLEKNDPVLLQDSITRVDELLETKRVNILGGIGWGYPFDWQSHELIPENTPNGIVTTAVGEYYWTRYKTQHDATALKACVQICSFLSSLPIDHLSEKELCFSYIPHYQNHVHNLNLFVADFLIKVGLEINNTEWVNLGNKAVSYTINDQREDGSFDYNGPPEKPQNFVDNYHTGFVLRMLGSCYHYTKREDVKIALEKGLEFYISNFFLDDGTPKLKPDQVYRVDIHSATEAINCLTFLSEYHEKAFSTSERVLKWTLEHLYDNESKDFFYAIMKSRFTGRSYTSKIKYMRWGQAWMLRALSRYILYSEQKKIIL
ncbi:MAG: hypothetical protein BalsKO_32110 [Balneolaceae bacterium]